MSMQDKVETGISVKREDSNFCQGRSMMQDACHEYVDLQNEAYISSSINAISRPQSIFQSNAKNPVIDDYIKIKEKDKPKDTMCQIQHKKQAFITYITRLKLQQQPINTQCKEKNQNQFTRIRQQFPEFSFKKNGTINTVLFIKVFPSKPSKCNISIFNLLGEVVKYYPNIFQIKKEGKIIKFLSQNQNSYHFVYDYTRNQNTIKTFPSLLNASRLLYYSMVEMARVDPMVVKQIRQRIQKCYEGQLAYENGQLVLMSSQIQFFQNQGDLLLIFQKIRRLQQQNQQILTLTRGAKQKYECNLAYDMMIINLWRQFKWSGQFLTNQIIQLFTFKQMQVDQTILKQPQMHHTPKRRTKAQNCSLCLSNNPDIFRPRRTHWICTNCSIEKEKPIYFCKECFSGYHTTTDLYIFRKHEKNTKRYRHLRLRRQQKSRLNGSKPKTMHEGNDEERVTKRQMILLELDKKCDEIFDKLDELIDQKSYASSEYYLQMLMNMTIIQTHQYLQGKNIKQDTNIIKQDL